MQKSNLEVTDGVLEFTIVPNKQFVMYPLNGLQLKYHSEV